MDKLLKTATAGFTVILLGLLLASPVSAQGNPRPSTSSQNLRLQDAKLKSCQSRQEAVRERSTRLAELAQNMESKFDAIATRVEEYYSSKVVPSGKTVAGYDGLVLSIQDKKAAVNQNLIKAQEASSGFSCSLDDPKALLTEFRQDMQVVKKSLKEYRTSIKNLIVAVRSSVGEEQKVRPSPKP